MRPRRSRSAIRPLHLIAGFLVFCLVLIVGMMVVYAPFQSHYRTTPTNEPPESLAPTPAQRRKLNKWLHASSTQKMGHHKSSATDAPTDANPRKCEDDLSVALPVASPAMDELNEGYRRWLKRSASLDTEWHAVVVVDCTEKSLWQALTLERSFFRRSGLNGRFTRIVTRCDEFAFMADAMKRHALPSEDALGVYFAPPQNQSTVRGVPYDTEARRYAPLQRPIALAHWLRDNDIPESSVLILDPDMIFVSNITASAGRFWPDSGTRPGLGFAQSYTYVEQQLLEIHTLCQALDEDEKDSGTSASRLREAFASDSEPLMSLCTSLQSVSGVKRLSVGAPYVAHRDTLRTMLTTWIAATSRIRTWRPELWIADMVGFAVAASHCNLVVSPASVAVESLQQPNVWTGTKRKAALAPSVSIIHYCQQWRVHHTAGEDFFFGKMAVPTSAVGASKGSSSSVLSCESPLLKEFDSASLLQEGSHPSTNDFRSALVLDKVVPAINGALADYRSHVLHCSRNSRRDDSAHNNNEPIVLQPEQ